MTKYDIVVYHRDGDGFLVRLQELGLMDVTTTGWEPTADEMGLMTEIEKRRTAVTRLRGMQAEGVLCDGSCDVWRDYEEATAHIEELEARIATTSREAEGLKVWGEFDPAALRELGEAGLGMRFFGIYTRDFEALRGLNLDIVRLNEVDGVTYFVVIGNQIDVDIDAREFPVPVATAAQKEADIEVLKCELDAWEMVLRRAAAGVELIERQADDLSGELDLRRVAASAARPAEGALLVLEGWATRETAEQVDEFLDGAGVYYQRSAPTPGDEVPVVLKNKKWSSPFEIIGNFYALPRYGTLDLTAFFGPFYMLFFGFCLGDAGYGLMFVLGGLIMRQMAKKRGGGSMIQVSNLTFLCGAAAIVFGFLVGGFFGVELAKLSALAALRAMFLTPDMLFVLALGLGMIQIIFAFVLRIVNTSMQFGFRYSLGTVGWLMVVCALVYVALPSPEVHKLLTALSVSYRVYESVFYALAGVGVVLMLFFHNPAKNPLLNLGGGLWNTYNDVTGLLGDLLSYIRLFALCLSGGTLALVFNKLAGDLPLPLMIVVLLIGHGLNLFMSALGSFVHPMRLTFVEFYKNAGFEIAQREFKPLKRK